MKLRYRRVTAWVSLLLLIACAFPTHVPAQTPTKAIVLAWDGAVPAFVHEMLRSGQLPNLAKLIEGGAFADDVITLFSIPYGPRICIAVDRGAAKNHRHQRQPRTATTTQPVYDFGEQCRV